MTDELSVAVITRELGTRIIGRKVLYYPVTTSTMDAAREAGREQTTHGTVVIAEEQTAARGRIKRTWIAPEGNIALSVVLYPCLSNLSSLIMLASLAVVNTIEAVTGLKSQIKWPNDVLINGKKVCGILIESDLQKNTVNYSIIGIGINVNLTPADFPEIESIATSLTIELGRDVSRLSLTRRLLVEMDSLYQTVLDGGSIYEPWRDNLVTLGSQVCATTIDEIHEGIAESVDREGSLLLRGSDGKLTRIVAGDVTLRQ